MTPQMLVRLWWAGMILLPLFVIVLHSVFS